MSKRFWGLTFDVDNCSATMKLLDVLQLLAIPGAEELNCEVEEIQLEFCERCESHADNCDCPQWDSDWHYAREYDDEASYD